MEQVRTAFKRFFDAKAMSGVVCLILVVEAIVRDKKLIALVQQLVSKTQQLEVEGQKDLSLLGGIAGRLLFLWYAAKSPDISIDTDKFKIGVQHLITEYSKLNNVKNFGYGIFGVAWLLELLLMERDEGYDAEFNQELELVVTRSLTEAEFWSGEIEFVLGLSGIAVFAARRLKNNLGFDLYGNIIRLLSDLAIYDSEDACCWKVPPNSIFRSDKADTDKPEFNLGLAHGVTGVISSLLPAIGHPIFGSSAAKLVSGGCNWLLKQKISNGLSQSLFSNLSGSVQPSRLGWCYGDLTIALTLARSGKMLGCSNLLEQANEIGLHAAKRTAENSTIFDTGLCHGSAGIMLIFQLLNQILPSPEYEKASDYWFDYTYAQYQEKGISGFYAYRGAEYVEEFGLLEGYGGIGLCLLTKLGITPDWADGLMLAY